MSLRVTPITLAEANAFVARNHRHHEPVVGHKFSVAVSEGERVRGVAIVGRPVSRRRDDGWTLEVTRCCTDGARNACSMLYATCWRAARALGYTRLGTYILEAEGGASLRAAGWKCLGRAGARSGQTWNVPSRPRVPVAHGQKELWEATP